MPGSLAKDRISQLINNRDDVAMNVPTSFDYREVGGASSRQMRAQKHLELKGVTTPVDNHDKTYQSNQLLGETAAMGRISSLKDEDNLNQHWNELMQLDVGGASIDSKQALNKVTKGIVPYNIAVLNQKSRDQHLKLLNET